MNLNYAVDKLYEVGWLPSEDGGTDFERLHDGRRYPSVSSVQQRFGASGLRLIVKPKATFKCYQAMWCPLDEQPDPAHESDERHGTVIASCEKEAAVYALAQLLASSAEVAVGAR